MRIHAVMSAFARGPRARGSTIAVYIWGLITVIGVVIVLRSLRAGQNEMAYIAALFAANDGASVRPPRLRRASLRN
jgi:hypothetical protein